MSAPDADEIFAEEVFEEQHWQRVHLVSEGPMNRILLVRKISVRDSNDEYGEILKITERTTRDGLDIGRPIDKDVDIQHDLFIPTFASLRLRQSCWPVDFGRHRGKEWHRYPIRDLSAALRLQHLVTGWQVFGNVRGVSCEFNYKRHRLRSYSGSGQVQIWVHRPQILGEQGNQLTPVSTGSSRLSGLSLNSTHTLIQSHEDENVMVVDEGWHPMLMLFLEANDDSGPSLWKIKNIFDFEAVDGPSKDDDATVLLQPPRDLRIFSHVSAMKSVEHGTWNLCDSTPTNASTGHSRSRDRGWEEWECGKGGITINFGKKLNPDNLKRAETFKKELKKQRIIYNIKRSNLERTRRTQTADIEAEAIRTPPASRPSSHIGVQPPSRSPSLRVPDRPPEIPLEPLPHIPRVSLGLREIYGERHGGSMLGWEAREGGNEQGYDGGSILGAYV